MTSSLEGIPSARRVESLARRI